MTVMPGRLPDWAGQPLVTIVTKAHPGVSGVIEDAGTWEVSGIALQGQILQAHVLDDPA
jgi:hypothetical protein